MPIGRYQATSALARPGVIPNAAARPASPYEGQVVYQTDTNQTFVWDGSTWTLLGPGTTAYQYAQTIYYTTVGTSTFTKASYPWLRAIKVMCQGGGGGGAGWNSPGSGPAGGAGGYAESFITDIAGLASSVTITVGGGGAGGAAGLNSGASGGNSSFGSTVIGYGGGLSDLGNLRGGAGGSGIGTLVVVGGAGEGTFPTAYHTSRGGDSHLGGGAQGNFSNITRNGNNAPGWGGGGGGGACSSSVSPLASGGNGNQGIVILELYA